MFLLFASMSVYSNNIRINSAFLDEPDSMVFYNPIDSIVYVMESERSDEDILIFRMNPEKIYHYLITHPDFIKNSDNVGYKNQLAEYEAPLLWKDCGEIRLYSIPYSSNRGLIYRTIVQFKGDGRVDTSFFSEDDIYGLEDLFQLQDKKGKTHYILITRYYYEYFGTLFSQEISSFVIEDGKLVNDEIFHMEGEKVGKIGCSCGYMSEPVPLDLEALNMILYEDDKEMTDTPVIIIAETTPIWPTGQGMKFQWNGNFFEYVGKCKYHANNLFDF